MDERSREEVVELVAAMILADKVLDPSECLFLNRLKVRLGLSVHGGGDSLPICGPAEAAARFGALPEAVRAETLDLLLEAAIADGQVADSERDLLATVASTMGVGRDDIDAALARRLPPAR